MPSDLPQAPASLPAVDPSDRRPGVALPPASPRADTLTVLAIGVTVVVALYIGQTLLVPLALAALLSFALAPLVSRFQRWRLGRVPSVLLAVLIALAMLVGVGTIVANQVVALAQDLPQYEQNIRTKIRDIRAAMPGGGLMERTTEVIRDIGAEITRDAEETPPEAETAGPIPPSAPTERSRPKAPEPVPVRVEEGPRGPAEMLRLAAPALAPVAMAGLVLVFVVFMLLQRHDLRDRLISLAGTRDMRKATQALDEAGQRVSRYLLTHLLLNLAYGVPVAVGLWLIGVPNPALWGMLATVLRFIPFLGPVIAAFFPIALSIAVDPGWTLPLMTIALVVALELFSNNVLEPWLYGTSTGLSPFAVVLAAIFWTALWGPVGLLLATPLTVCLVVLGKHVPQLGFLEVLLGSRPPLPAPARIYQRLLARAPDEVARIAEDMITVDAPPAGDGTAPEDGTQARGVAWVHDTLLLPALKLAEQDRAAGNLSQGGQTMVLDGIEATLGLLDAREEVGRTLPVDTAPGSRVLVIAARSTLDEAAGLLLADLLHDHGLEAEVLPCEAAGVRALPRLPRDGVVAVVLSYLDSGSGRHPTRLVRRLRRHFGAQMPLLIGDWQQAGHRLSGLEEPALGTTPAPPPPPTVTGADGVAGCLAEAVEMIQAPLAGRHASANP